MFDFKMLNDLLNNNVVNLILIISLALFQCVLLPKIPASMLKFADNIVLK